MIKPKLKYNNNLNTIYSSILDEVNAKAKAKNKYSSCSGIYLGKKRFNKIIKTYFKILFERVIYKYQSVEFYRNFGVIQAHKILCTKFNPKFINIMKTDGYFYFLFWDKPKDFYYHKFLPCKNWKTKLFKNVIDNGADYPEIYENTYRQNS